MSAMRCDTPVLISSALPMRLRPISALVSSSVRSTLSTFCLSAVVTSFETANSVRSASLAPRATASRVATVLLPTTSLAVVALLPMMSLASAAALPIASPVAAAFLPIVSLAVAAARPMVSLAAVALLLIEALNALAVWLSVAVASVALRFNVSAAAALAAVLLPKASVVRARKLGEHALGVARIGLDRYRQLFDPRADEVGGSAAAHLDLLRHRFGAFDEQMLQTVDAGLERAGKLLSLRAERPVDVGDALADALRKPGPAGVDHRGDIGNALVERGDDFLAAVRERLGDIQDAA